VKRLEKQPWWSDLLAVKDTLSLREMSEKFGASPAAIANALKRNGLKRVKAPAGPRRPRKAKRPGRRSVLDKFQGQMGTVVDREIAELAGVTVSAVTNYRKRHNIKASTGRGRPRKRPDAGPISRPKKGARGYRVVIGGQPFVVIAADIAEAATKAKANGRGEVTQIELLGRALG
jgi:transposase